MTLLVVDASVAVKWFVPQDHSERALALRNAGHQLIAPDLIHAEFANAMWKYVRANQLSADEAFEVLKNFQQTPLDIFQTAPILPAALHLAVASGSSVYDALYVALAAAHKCRLITADRKLIARFGDVAAWIGTP